MGESKSVICRDCDEYADVQKMFFPHYRVSNNSKEWFEEAFRTGWKKRHLERMMAFMDKHRGHDITLLGEYMDGLYQEEYWSTLDMEEFTLE